MKKLCKKFIAFTSLSLALFIQSASAQAPLYKIEVIAFESLALNGWTQEYWPELVETPNTSNTTSVFNYKQRPLWINKANKNLDSEANALNKKGYRVLFHKAWTQFAYANKKGHQVLVEGSNPYGSSMLGTVRLYKTRFAHVDLNLEFSRLIPTKVKEKFALSQNTNLDTLPPSWQFSLQESRKIRPNELHYIDHPLFGVLVKVTPIKQ